MKKIKLNIFTWCFSLFYLAIFFSSSSLKANYSLKKDSLEILFIGSSYFNYYNLPLLVKNLAVKSGKKVIIDSFMPNGFYLANHAQNSETISKINERNWDFVILQGVGSLMAYPDFYIHYPESEGLITLKNRILSNYASTEIIYCMPWAYEDGMTWLGWPDNYADMQMLIYKRTIDYANKIDFTIAPVGWAWAQALHENNYPLHYLHDQDWNHPSVKGSYLMACVIYSTIFITESTNIPFYSVLLPEEAAYFQQLGSKIVLNDLTTWRINHDIDSLYTNLTPINQMINYELLSQNYPNPFQTATNIPFHLKEGSLVNISIFDILGNYCTTVLNEFKTPGKHIVSFNAANLSDGIYIYKIQIKNRTQVRRMEILK